MDQHHEGGHIVPPTPTGKRATLMMQVHIMVEVNDTDDYNDMVWQAKEELRKRIVEGKGFFPFRSLCMVLHSQVEVEDLKYQTDIRGFTQW